MKKIICITVILNCVLLSAKAQQFKIAGIFGDNMVLQQQTETAVRGEDKAGTTLSLTASWNGQNYSSVADKNGVWEFRIKTPVAGGPYTIWIQGSQTATVSNVWIGEVWLASEQSNMSMQLKGYHHQPVSGSTEAILNAKNKKIHFINIPAMAAYKPLENFDAQWMVASTETAGECSAVCWFFAEMLHKLLDVPVGIINASYSGSSIEAWMTPEACRRFSDIEVPPASDETSAWINNVPTVLYNGMIHPPEISAYQREAQLKSQRLVKNSAMAVLMDIGEEKQIHPSRKKEVGERLALLALSKTYGMKGFESESPEYERMEVEGDKAILYFSKQFMGLTSHEKPLQLFEIAGENKKTE